MRTYNSRTADKFVVRLPEGMRERLSDAAFRYAKANQGAVVWK